MSTPIRQNPSERLGTRQSRELQAQEEATRQLNQQGLDVAGENATSSKQPTARLNALVDQATQRTQATPQTEQARGTSTAGATGAAPLNRTATADELGGHQQVFGTSETRLGAPTAPRVQLTPSQVSGAQSFAHNLDLAMGNALDNAGRLNALAHLRADGATTGTGARLSGSDIRGLGPDELLSEFLKLNINDPNENVETHNKLTEISTTLRLRALEDAKKQSENARQMMKEAEAYAKQAEMIGQVVQVASIALTICTFGAGAAVGVAATAASTAATQAATQVGQQMLAQVSQEALKQVVETAGKQAAELAMKEAAKAGTQMTSEMAQKAIVEATSKATQDLMAKSPQLVEKAIQDTIQEAAKNGVQITAEQAKTAVTQQIYNRLLPQVTEQTVKEMTTKGLTAQAQTVSKVGAQLAQDAASRSVTTGMQGFVNRSGDVLAHMQKGVAGQMTRGMVVAGGVAQGVHAVAQFKSAEKMADAREAQLQVTRSRFQAEQAQQVIEQEGDIINTIMESKNQTIDAVMQMTNATWASRQQLLAATMAR